MAEKVTTQPEPEKKGEKVSTTKKEIDSLAQKMKKTKLTSGAKEDVDELLTMSFSSSIKINVEAQHCVFKLECQIYT